MKPEILTAIIGAVATVAAAIITAIISRGGNKSKEKNKKTETPDQTLEQDSGPAAQKKRISWQDTKGLFQIDKFTLAYIPLMNDWWTEKSRISEVNFNSLKISLNHHKHQLPEVFKKTQIDYDFRDEPSCRLLECRIGDAKTLDLVFGETSYGDYLRSGEHLDDPYPTDPRETFRSALATIVKTGGGEVHPKGLTNICGTGIFLITSDNMIVVAKHSEHSHVYPARWTFSASGLMKWGACPHPFMEMARKTFAEIHHQVDPAKVKLIGLGADARKLYFQFSFIEETGIPSREIIERHNRTYDNANQSQNRDRPRELICLPFQLEEIINSIIDHVWEPSAESCILTLCARRFGPERVVQELHARRRDWWKREMRDEWDLRSSNKGDLPDMSIRYDRDRLGPEKERYIQSILSFMKDDLDHQDILEIGCGTGSLSIHLVQIANHLTCIDLCERMIERNKQRLGEKSRAVNYVITFMQEYPAKKHQVAICSQVLIHNVSDSDFTGLVGRICECSDTAFIFEDVTEGRPTSTNVTRLRPKQELVEAFEKFNFHLERSSEHMLFEDKIALLKFVKAQ